MFLQIATPPGVLVLEILSCLVSMMKWKLEFGETTGRGVKMGHNRSNRKSLLSKFTYMVFVFKIVLLIF